MCEKHLLHNSRPKRNPWKHTEPNLEIITVKRKYFTVSAYTSTSFRWRGIKGLRTMSTRTVDFNSCDRSDTIKYSIKKFLFKAIDSTMKDSVGSPTLLWALQSKTHSDLIIHNRLCMRTNCGGRILDIFPQVQRFLKNSSAFHHSTSVTTRPLEIWLCLTDKTKILLFFFILKYLSLTPLWGLICTSSKLQEQRSFLNLLKHQIKISRPNAPKSSQKYSIFSRHNKIITVL